jgi:outer membrane receptor protein involved in Fe transport
MAAASLLTGALFKSVLLTTTSGLLAATAGAQEEIPDAIEEIVVLATRREASLQDVPVAVTAVTGTMLVDSGVEDVYMLQEQAPSLVVSRSQQSTTASFAIRGVGTSSQNSGLESSVGLYVDEVYRPRQSSIINNLVDMQSVEVLRGPQGTLFGKNTPSGAILFRTVTPFGSDGRAATDLDGFLEATVGNFGLLNVSAATNIPLIDDVLAMRGTVFIAKRDGYVSEVTRGEDIINDVNRQGGRLQLGWTPNDRLTMRAIVDYSEVNEICCANLTRQDSLFSTMRTPPVPGTDQVIRLLGGTTFTLADFERRIMALNKLPESTNKDRGLSVQFDYDFENSTLTSITAVRRFNTFDDIDVDFTDVPLFDKSNDIEQQSFSQEFRLDGEFGERTRYVAGLYYFDQDITSDANTTVPSGAIGTQYLLATTPQAKGLVDFVNLIALQTSMLPTPDLPPAGQAIANGTFARDTMLQDHRSWAAFAQADFDLTDSFVLTAGLRYTDEKKTLQGTFTQNPLGPPPNLLLIGAEVAKATMNPATYNPYSPESLAALGPIRVPGWASYFPELTVFGPRPNVTETLSDDQVSGTFKLTWFANDDLMFYGSFGTGYKSGGTNTDRIGRGFSYVFGPETSQSYELGMKGTFFDRSLQFNIAAHKTDVEDLQANSFTGTGFNLQNAGKAKTHGAEVEMLWRPGQIFDLQLAYTWSVAEFEDFQRGTCWRAWPFHTGMPDPGLSPNPLTPTCDRSGGLLPSNPEHNVFAAATFDFPIGGNLNLFIRPEANYYSETMTDGNNDPLKFRDPYTVWNLRAGVEIISLDASIIFWGRNITDEAHYETIFDVPLQDGKLNAYPREARTYGATFRIGF